MEEYRNIRVVFSKTERVKYISHLDLNRAFQRSLKRTGLDVYYTQGFNPHIDLVLSPPLSVGFISMCEVADFRVKDIISDNDILKRLNAALPDGIRALRIADASKKICLIRYCDYEITADGIADFSPLDAETEIKVIKKTKKTETEIDLKPYFCSMTVDNSNGYSVIRVVLPCTEGAVNPQLLMNAASEKCGFDCGFRYMRKDFLDNDLKKFC